MPIIEHPKKRRCSPPHPLFPFQKTSPDLGPSICVWAKFLIGRNSHLERRRDSFPGGCQLYSLPLCSASQGNWPAQTPPLRPPFPWHPVPFSQWGHWMETGEQEERRSRRTFPLHFCFRQHLWPKPHPLRLPAGQPRIGWTELEASWQGSLGNASADQPFVQGPEQSRGIMRPGSENKQPNDQPRELG